MSKLTITSATEEEFFAQGRQLAKLADRGAPLPHYRIISFEDAADIGKLLSAARVALFRAIKEKPGSITELATRLQRDRSAVKRDVDELEKFGFVTVSEKVLPGHGRMKEVRAAAVGFRLQADIE